MPAFQTIVVPVSDLESAKRIYTAALGAEPHTDQPYYVGYNVDGCEFGLAPKAMANHPTGPVAYLDVPDAAQGVQDLVAAGATVVQDATEVGGGTTVAVLADADGNVFGLRSYRAG